MFNLMFLL